MSTTLFNGLAENLMCVAGRIRWLTCSWNAFHNGPDAIPQAAASKNTICAFLNCRADKRGYRKSFVGRGGMHALFEYGLKPHALWA
jgi:hypothetical protein